LRNTLALCAERGLLEIGDLETTAQVTWAAIHGLTSLLIAHPKFQWLEQNRLIDTLIGMLTAGLKPVAPVLVH
jgi:hypothetical protein